MEASEYIYGQLASREELAGFEDKIANLTRPMDNEYCYGYTRQTVSGSYLKFRSFNVENAADSFNYSLSLAYPYLDVNIVSLTFDHNFNLINELSEFSNDWQRVNNAFNDLEQNGELDSDEYSLLKYVYQSYHTNKVSAYVDQGLGFGAERPAARLIDDLVLKNANLYYQTQRFDLDVGDQLKLRAEHRSLITSTTNIASEEMEPPMVFLELQDLHRSRFYIYQKYLDESPQFITSLIADSSHPEYLEPEVETQAPSSDIVFLSGCLKRAMSENFQAYLANSSQH